jgi:hypothetical protein
LEGFACVFFWKMMIGQFVRMKSGRANGMKENVDCLVRCLHTYPNPGYQRRELWKLKESARGNHKVELLILFMRGQASYCCELKTIGGWSGESIRFKNYLMEVSDTGSRSSKNRALYVKEDLIVSGIGKRLRVCVRARKLVSICRIWRLASPYGAECGVEQMFAKPPTRTMRMYSMLK